MATNNWTSAVARLWNAAIAWSLGHVPLIGEDVLQDAAGVGDCSLNVSPPALNSFTQDVGYIGKLTLQAAHGIQAGIIDLAGKIDIGVAGSFVVTGAVNSKIYIRER